MGMHRRPMESVLSLLLIFFCSGVAAAAGSNPSDLPLPDFADAFDDPRRALVLEVDIQAGSASLVDAYVSETPPAGHVGEPAQLYIRWYDADGLRIGSRAAWDPRWEFSWDDGVERHLKLPAAIGAFDIPFSSDITTIQITDVATGLVLLQQDVRNTVLGYCQAAPADPNCEGSTGELDSDGDGVDDSTDNCIDTANADQLDTDSDGLGDLCDADDDNDSFADDADNCPLLPNPDQLDTDNDGLGNVCDADDDNDSFADDADNCPLLPNPDQLDSDDDGLGNVCDEDDDNDGFVDLSDNCPVDANADQADLDADGIGDVCDADDDNDGVNDTVDNCPVDANPGQADSDNDDIGDACDTDNPADGDGDGIIDSADYCPDTQIPEAVPTTGTLRSNRWALRDPGQSFVQAGPQAGADLTITLADTRGCSCEQIIAATGLGKGHSSWGCSTGAMLDWINGSAR